MRKFWNQSVKTQILSGARYILRICERSIVRSKVTGHTTDLLNAVGEEIVMSENRDYTANRDYTLIIDKSGSMSKKDRDERKIQDEQDLKSRWELMQESTIALASKCEKLDPDGITVYTFSKKFKRYENVTASDVEQIFEDNEPMGPTYLAEVLQDALDNYFQRKEKGETKLNGETILIVTDGAPDNKVAVAKTIIGATQRMDRDEELALSFIQIGNEKEAGDYLKFLDDQLKETGEAKFDIVDTVTLDEIEDEGVTLKEVLLRAITD